MNHLQTAPLKEMRAENTVHAGTLALGLLGLASFKEDPKPPTQTTMNLGVETQELLGLETGRTHHKKSSRF